MSARWSASAWLAVVSIGLFGAAPPARPQDAPQRNPELVAKDYTGRNGGPRAVPQRHSLQIGRLDIDEEIVGGVARTTVTAKFDNPGSAPLEGDFTLELPAGSTVTGYALDVNGRMVDGVLVDQRKGELAYERKVRQGMDPGLAVVTRANAFNTRVFPVLPGRGRTIRLTFTSAATPQTPLRLPLSTEEPVGRVSITIHAVDVSGRPVLRAPEGLALVWTGTGDGLEAHAEASNVALAGALEVGPLAQASPVSLSRGPDATFFAIADSAGGSARTAATAEKARIFWDRSRAGRDEDHAADLALVQRYLQAIKPREIEVVSFADDAPRVETFATADAALAALKAVDYRGAASLRGVFQAAPGRADACLFVSPGRIGLDPYRAERTKCALFTLSTDRNADHDFLSALARKSGGEEIDLRALGADAALGRLTDAAPRVIAVRSGGEDLDFARLPTGSGFRVVARAPADRGVEVELSDGETRAYDLSGPVRPDVGLGSLWARDRIAELAASDRPDRDQILALARRYSVAGDGVAFVVLETIDDYVRNGIEPPAMLGKDALAQYREGVARLAAEKKAKEAERLDGVAAAWAEEESWWATKFPSAPKTRKPGKEGPAVGAAALQREAPPPPPPPPPSPVPSPATAPMAAEDRAQGFIGRRAGAGSVQEVVVTGSRMPASGPMANAPAVSATIDVKTEPWNPDRPYLKTLAAAAPGDWWNVFHVLEQEHGDLPAFYLDVARQLWKAGRKADAIEVLQSALEVPSADDATLIIVADRLLEYGQTERALWLYEKVLFLESDRPQPYRNLALALVHRAEAGEPAADRKRDYLRALDLMNQVVSREWESDYDGFELVVLSEANRIIPKLRALGVDKVDFDPRLIKPLDVDLRITLEWNVDATDMDLWVDEPTGERVIYNNPKSAIGGRLSHDMTRGYGPEEYLLHVAPAGDYVVRANIFRTDQLNPNGAITVRAHLYRNWGRPDEKDETLDLELRPGEDGERKLGTITVKR